MRIAFVGAVETTIATARLLIARGHEVVIVENDQQIIDELEETLDCSFLRGDGGNPAVLKEVDPKGTDILFCLTDSDQVNLIAGLVGRSLGFERIIIGIHNMEFEKICRELGLENTILPSRTISRYLADMVSGVDVLELSTVIKGEARFFMFIAEADDAVPVEELNLPAGAKVVCYYREGEFALADEKTKIRKKDDVVILTHSKNLNELRERWSPQSR